MMNIPFKILDPRAIPPRQAHPGEDAGWDLFALEDTPVKGSAYWGPGMLTWVRTGIALAIPDGYYGRIVGRSSAASRGFLVVEGIIDSGYRGEQMMRVSPTWDLPVAGTLQSEMPQTVIMAGTSLAQLIIQKVPNVTFYQVEELPPSQRGEKGFGSSGR